MPQKIAKEDIADLDLVDARELLSDGTDEYQSGVGVISTTNGTSTVVVSGGLIFNDDPVQSGDPITLAGTSGGAADGDFTVDTVVSDTEFTVVEAIATSSGGTAAFKHPPAATKIGIDPTKFRESNDVTLQQFLETAELQIRLAESVDEGPLSTLLTGAFKEVLPLAAPFPTSIIWYESAAKLKKIIEKTITRSGGGASNVAPTPIVWKVYDTDGATVLLTISDAIVYANNVFESTRTRTIS